MRFRAPLKTSAPLRAVIEVFGAEIRPLLQDRYLAPDLEASARLVRGDALLTAAGVSASDLESL